MLLKEPACLSLNGISIEQEVSQSDLSLSSHLWDGRWQELLHFPMFILATQIFPESDRIALPFLGSLSDASLKVACFPDGCGEREECQSLSFLSEACCGSPAVTLEEVTVKMNSVLVGSSLLSSSVPCDSLRVLSACICLI